MRSWLPALLCAFTGAATGAATELPSRAGQPCIDCHQEIVRSFNATRMAAAAASNDYVVAWNANGRAAHCTECHAPSGGDGLTCADCHGPGPHPYPRLPVPQTCARCHDAPGENTVRSFMQGPAVRRGQDCLTCHLESGRPDRDHGFRGPSTPGFLNDTARIRIFLRKSPAGETTALLRVVHKAGHALPGGTTGRSVWLIVTGIRDDGTEAWRESIRFGWEHHPDRGWVDRTLPAGSPTTLELPHPAGKAARRLLATLWYRFHPGPFEEHDPREVRLDVQEMELME